MACAEALVDGRAPLPSRTAAHVACCERCRAEVESIRASLVLVHRVGAIEPSREFTATVLLAAKSRQREIPKLRRRYERLEAAARVCGYAGALAALASVAFVLVAFPPQGRPDLVQANHGPETLPAAPSFAAADRDSRRDDEEILRQAALAPSGGPVDDYERQYWRAVSAFDEDISEGLAALKNNPFSIRASRIVELNRQRRTETLKTIVLEKNL